MLKAETENSIKNILKSEEITKINQKTEYSTKNNKKTDKNYNKNKKITLNLTSYTQDFPKNLKALILMYMKAHNIAKIILDYKNDIARYYERTPKQMWISLWLNGELTNSEFKKEMQYNIEETSEDLEDFLHHIENWFNSGRFRNG
ncbi:hypothetical protein KJA15_03580 [Patescibacteria group bacterium]|nr:hypothetical protein [Patescibacteria group bacterium]